MHVAPTPMFRCLLLTLLVAAMPSHFSLQESGPPLIPRELFDSAAEHDQLTISPDGTMLAYIAPSDKGVANIWVEKLSNHEKRMVSRATRGLADYQWAYDNKHLLYHSDENGNEDNHIYSIDLGSAAIRDLT